MTKVNINGHSHQVEVEHDGTLDEVVDSVRKLWEATLQPDTGPAGPAFGFRDDLRPVDPVSPSNAGAERGWPYSEPRAAKGTPSPRKTPPRETAEVQQ